MTEPERHDWPRIISEITAQYAARHARTLSLYKLGVMVGLDHSSMRHLTTHPTAQPKHWHGERLLEVHREYCRVGNSAMSESDAPGT